jgi:hypothetical protein
MLADCAGAFDAPSVNSANTMCQVRRDMPPCGARHDGPMLAHAAQHLLET